MKVLEFQQFLLRIDLREEKQRFAYARNQETSDDRSFYENDSCP